MTGNQTTATGLAAKILLLGAVAAIAVWAAFPLVAAGAWVGLAVLAAVTALLFAVYLSPKRVPAKYLVPGTLLLVAFQVLPVAYTVGTAFTNFGDGHRGSKAEAVTAIQTGSVQRVTGSAEYTLQVGARGGVDGPLVFLLTDAKTGKRFVGDARGLTEVADFAGFTVLNFGQAGARGKEIADLVVPTERGAIRAQGLSQAYEGQAQRRYSRDCDCVRDSTTGKVFSADNDNGAFVAADGEELPQGWRVGTGLRNFAAVVTDPAVARPFFGTLLWSFGFALGSVLVTFALGLVCALALHHERIRGRAVYRVLLVLPYAMPSFAMLLVWRDMFNADFGLVNRLLGLDVDWFGGPWTARFAVIVVQLWLGYPYMFLVATGALQAIPASTVEAAAIDGASPWQAFRRITLPLLLVALSPLLISSFAFNFNNFNAIYLTTAGGPFDVDSPTAGATDLLITYTYRLAFGGQGAQYGFAAAVSVYIFAIVAIVSAVSFRRTRRHEEVYG